MPPPAEAEGRVAVPAAGRGAVLATVMLLAPGAGAGSVILEVPFSSFVGTPLWWSPANTEARTYHVVGRDAAEGVAVHATATAGLVQLHVFPWSEDAPGFRADLVTRMDWIPAREKHRILPPGEWLVAVDPSAPATTGTVSFTGMPGTDTVTATGAWRCPVFAVRGCTP